MDPEQAWQSALGQLQMEMPKSSFDTWVRDTRLISYNEGLFTVGARNAYAREWLESRVEATASRLLAGIMNRDVIVHFDVAAETPPEAEASGEELPLEAEFPGKTSDAEYLTRTAYCTLYDKIVQPRTVIVLERYLILRLLPWIGARAFWMYVGFHQAAWMNLRGNVNGKNEVTTRLAAPNIARYAGVGRATLFRWMKDAGTWQALRGLVKRTHLGPEWDEDRGGNMHKLANEYRVFLTPPLSWPDAYSVYGWLAARITAGATLDAALEAALDVPGDQLVGEMLLPLEKQPSIAEMEKSMPQSFLTVMDVARDLSLERTLPESTQIAAELLHTKIVRAFGDTGIKVYFVETVIPRTKMTPEQAALVVAARCRTYTNETTGEVRNRIPVPRGCAEMGSWIGLSREKTVWEWVNGEVRRSGRDEALGVRAKKTLKDVGPIPGFLKVEYPHRGEDRTPRLYVRLMEPLFDLPSDGGRAGGPDTSPDGGARTMPAGGLDTSPDGGAKTRSAGEHGTDRGGGLDTYSDGGVETIRNGGPGTNRDGAPETNKDGGAASLEGGIETLDWRTWDVLNDLKYLLTTFRIRSSKSSFKAQNQPGAVDKLSQGWDLKELLFHSEVYPANIKKLLEARISAEQFIAWLLYTMSPYGQRLKLEPVRVTVKSLLDDPGSLPPAPVFAALARLPKHVLFGLVAATRESGEGVPTGNADWDEHMGPVNPRIEDLRKALFGASAVPSVEETERI